MSQQIIAAGTHLAECQLAVNEALTLIPMSQIIRASSTREAPRVLIEIKSVTDYQAGLNAYLMTLQVRLDAMEQQIQLPATEQTPEILAAELSVMRGHADETVANARQCQQDVVTKLNRLPIPSDTSQLAEPSNRGENPPPRRETVSGSDFFPGMSAHAPISVLNTESPEAALAPPGGIVVARGQTEITPLPSLSGESPILGVVHQTGVVFPRDDQTEHGSSSRDSDFSSLSTVSSIPLSGSQPSSSASDAIAPNRLSRLLRDMEAGLARSESEIAAYINAGGLNKSTAVKMRDLQLEMEDMRTALPAMTKAELLEASKEAMAMADEVTSLVSKTKSSLITESTKKRDQFNEMRLHNLAVGTVIHALKNFDRESLHTTTTPINPAKALQYLKELAEMLPPPSLTEQQYTASPSRQKNQKLMGEQLVRNSALAGLDKRLRNAARQVFESNLSQLEDQYGNLKPVVMNPTEALAFRNALSGLLQFASTREQPELAAVATLVEPTLTEATSSRRSKTDGRSRRSESLREVIALRRQLQSDALLPPRA
ncbi:hypothetical protein GCM10022212_03040 [Actimicrobium antarcticum]|uniref:Uncharacterized protein n=2 Tax=Actimicrobium antarcticum TaxID=1051899 RepID=A0ABP7SJU5_9BURK